MLNFGCFFFKQKTAYEMRISDWSSDVCSSDLGSRITLPYPSVGATETVLLSAVLAEGRTVIANAATEPEVVELALFLQRMGAHISLRPDRRFVVEGVESLTGAEATLQGDRQIGRAHV